MYCGRRDQLFRAYRGAVQDWVESIKELKGDHAPKTLARIEKNRHGVALTKGEYRRHIEEHHCGKLMADISREEILGI